MAEKTGLTAREESYRAWRERLAEQQAAWRDEDKDSDITINPEWSPEALFERPKTEGPPS